LLTAWTEAILIWDMLHLYSSLNGRPSSVDKFTSIVWWVIDELNQHSDSWGGLVGTIHSPSFISLLFLYS
jgi:hypothetical protein